MSSPAQDAPAGLDLSALQAITDAVESGAGLPEVVRAAARAVEASLVLTDRGGSVLAVAARSPADEASLQDGATGVTTLELRVADEQVGTLRLRPHAAGEDPPPALLRLVTTLIASEVERVRAPARASQQAMSQFLADVMERRLTGGRPSRSAPRSSASTSSPARRCSSRARTHTCRRRTAGACGCCPSPSAARARSCRPRWRPSRSATMPSARRS
jgi:hypothetical protein